MWNGHVSWLLMCGLRQSVTHLCQRSTCLWIDWMVIDTSLVIYFQGVCDSLTIGMHSSPMGLIMPSCPYRSREVDFRDQMVLHTRQYCEQVDGFSSYAFWMGLDIEGGRHNPCLELSTSTLRPWLAWNYGLVIPPRPTTKDHPIQLRAMGFRFRSPILVKTSTRIQCVELPHEKLFETHSHLWAFWVF